jgi:AcrR family transcriptional regulator
MPQSHRAKRSNEPGPNGPGRPRSPAADRAILQAALKLFIKHGIDGASIEQIAERAGVARTTVYRRWSSKEALLAQAMAVARGAPEQRAMASRVASGSLAQRMVDALAETVTAPNYRKLVARLAGSVPNCPALMSIYWTNYLVPRRQMVRELLERARARGLLREDSDPEILLDLIGGAIMYHLLIRPGERTSREMRLYLFKVLGELGLGDTAIR